MDLPNLLSKFTHQQEEIQHFVAIEIALNVVKTAIWQVYRGKTEIVSLGTTVFWDYKTDDSLLLAVRESLAVTGEHLLSSTKQVILGLPESWADSNGISDERKSTLRMLCASLKLTPVGFVVTTESMVHYLRDLEGGPPSAILIYVMKEYILVTLVRLGILQGTSQLVGRSDVIGADVQEGLARFPTGDNLPSRMVIYDGLQDLEQIRQDLLAYDWQAKLDFMHFPKVELLNPDDSIKAVALAGGAEVAKSMGIAMDTETEAVSEEIYDSDAVSLSNKEDELTIEPLEQGELSNDIDDAPAFGFTSVSIEESPDLLSGEVSFAAASKTDVESGFTPSDEGLHESELIEVEPDEVFGISEEDLSDDFDQKPESKLAFILLPFRSIRSRLSSLKPSRSKSSNRRLRMPPLFTIGIVILLLLGVGGFLFYWYVPKAEVVIYLERKSLEKPVSFILDSERKGVDFDKNTIPGEKQEVRVAGTKQIQTTGTRVVGERASGRVVIFNRTTSPKTLSAGTEIESSSGMMFTLDEEVRIASASTKENSDLSITTEPSKQEAAVSAEAIGAQYNLAVDSEFLVANFARDSFIARSVTDFTGGSSREVAAVSADDIEQLKEALTSQLATEVSQKLVQQTDGLQAITDDSQTIEEEEYSHDLGDESDSLELSMTILQVVYTYDTKDLSLLAQQQVLAEIPSGFSLQPEATTIDVTDTEIQEDGTVAITARTQLRLLPDLDEREIARVLVGKYVPVTSEYLRALPSYVKSEIEIFPTLPSRLNTFPRSAERISISVVATD